MPPVYLHFSTLHDALRRYFICPHTVLSFYATSRLIIIALPPLQNIATGTLCFLQPGGEILQANQEVSSFRALQNLFDLLAKYAYLRDAFNSNSAYFGPHKYPAYPPNILHLNQCMLCSAVVFVNLFMGGKEIIYGLFV